MNLFELKDYLDKLLNINKIDDVSLNGLQVENMGNVDKIYGSVDISSELVKKAEEKSLIIVHHGIFWGKPVSITKNIYKLISLLIEKDCALYVSHLPLDIHEEFGNNHGFYKLLKWDKYKNEPFGMYKNLTLSSVVEFPEEIKLNNLLGDLYKVLGEKVVFWDFGKKNIKRLAFLSGAGALDLGEAVDKKIDLFITGETSHNSYWFAKENNINVIFAGHYNTEKTGVNLLLDHLSEKFSMKSNFIDLPTGL